MRITVIREWIARVFAILLIILLLVGVLLAMGKRVPIISDLLGR